jgi:small subunit ribosomal protein S20
LADKKSSMTRAVGVEKKRLRNTSVQTLCKTRITQAEGLIFSGEMEAAQKAVAAATLALDKAAEKGILHPNNAARRKSRLVKKLNEALAAASAAASQTKKSRAKRAKSSATS